MKQQFRKINGEIKDYVVQNGKVLCTIKINGHWVSNPSLEQFLAQGWEEYTPEPVETPQPTFEEIYKQKTVELIRERYSIDDEFEVNRERNVDSEAFTEYYNYVESCKEEARQWTEKFMEEIKK